MTLCRRGEHLIDLTLMGRFIIQTMTKEQLPNPVEFQVPNSVAAIWSMMLPGLGQMMKGQIMPGIFWSLGVASGYYAYFWPGLTLHAFCILDAALNRGGNSWLDLSTWPKRIGFVALAAGLISYIVFRNF